MAKKWVEVAASPAYQALAPEQQEEARNQYWSEVVAPNVPQQEQATVRQAFDADTQRTVNWPDAGTMEIPITGGTPGPASVGQSGVTREQRQQRIAAADEALDLDARRSSLDTQESIGRNLALGGRAMLRGVVGLPDMVVAPLVAGVNRLLPERYQQTGLTGMVDSLADKVGAPRPANAAERVSSDVTSAITGGATGIGVGNMLANLGARGVQSGGGNMLTSIGNTLQANPALQLVSAGTGAAAAGTTRESGGGTGAQLLAGLAGGLAPGAAGGAAALAGRTLLPNRLAQLVPEPVGAVPTALAGAVRRSVRGEDTQSMRDAIAAFDAAGTTPSVGQASGSRTASALETFAGNFPGGAGRIERLGSQQQEQVRGQIDDLSNSIAPNGASLTPQQVGATVQEGINGPSGFVNTFRGTASKLYNAVDKYLPGNTKVAAQNTDNFLTDLTTPTPGATNTSQVLANPFMERLAEGVAADLKANNGTIPYSALKSIRSQVGEKIADAGLNPDINVKQLRALYANLTEDMTAAVQATGNPRAVQLMDRANNYYKLGATRIDQIEKAIGKVSQASPEQAYMSLFNGVKNGATPLKRVMGALPPEARSEVTASFLQRMGRAAKGQQDVSGDAFSMRTFLTNWADLSPEAKKELFQTARYGKSFRDNIDKIARVTDAITKGNKVFYNSSGTTRQTALGGVITAVPSAAGLAFTGHVAQAAAVLASTASTVGAANLSARMMTNPRVVSWLASNTRRDAGDLVAQIQLLRQAGEKAGDDDAVEVADALSQRASQAPSAAPAAQ